MSFLQDLIDKGKDLIGWGEAKPPSQTEAVHRDSFDRADYHRVLDTAPAIQDLQLHLERTIPYDPDLLADLHTVLLTADHRVQ